MIGKASTPLGRRDVVARMAGIALSFVGLTPFSRAQPNASGVLRAKECNATKWDDKFELAVDLEIVAQQGYQSQRPYVAVWIEDSEGHTGRTLSLWVNKNGRGLALLSLTGLGLLLYLKKVRVKALFLMVVGAAGQLRDAFTFGFIIMIRITVDGTGPL